MEIRNFTTLLAFVVLCINTAYCTEGEAPIGKSHHSYFQFDTDEGIEPETAGRNKRAAKPAAKPAIEPVKFTTIQAAEIVRLHNQFRGGVKPEASNMEYMVSLHQIILIHLIKKHMWIQRTHPGTH